MTAAPTPLDFRTVNSLWGSVLVETLRRLGLRHAVISPGSRSTPLALALAREAAIESIPVLDERSAAFFALGLAKRHQRPVLLLCTSGTAGANYFPAVIEAQESGVPLLVITADRPPEMRECSSGQTIDQQKLFGSHVNAYHELAVPEASLAALRYLRQTLVQAWSRTTCPFAGPVHLNAPFRDPLAPVAGREVAGLEKRLKVETFFSSVQPPVPVTWQVHLPAIPVTARGLIIMGPAEIKPAAEDVEAVAEIARKLGWPVLVDVLSGLRGWQSKFPGAVTRYDAILRRTVTGRKLRPDFVLCIGGWPISKTLRAWLDATAPAIWMVAERPQNLDALHGATQHLRCGVKTLAAQIAPRRIGHTAYQAAWARAERAAVYSLGQALAKAKHFEGRVAASLSVALPEGAAVVLANSMPVRDADYFWPANDRRQVMYFNRGANGIDGTLSSALGLAHGHRNTVLLTGDLALLHDTNGFLLAPQFKGGLTIILINNNGGGIFEHLPVAGFNPPFERFFATPQNIDFKKLCATYGVKHTLVREEAQLKRLLGVMPAGIRVLEVGTDRKKDAARRKKMFAEAASAAEQALRG